MIEPVRFRYHAETGATNVFQRQTPPTPREALQLEKTALAQHRALSSLLVSHGVTVTLSRSRDTTPDAPFCNNWFSTHPGNPPTLVIYPLLARMRRLERRPDLIDLLRNRYPRIMDFAKEESHDRFLESTGSLCLYHPGKLAFAAISPRTNRDLAEEWAQAIGYRLIPFTATDLNGVPYYHTNVMMFLSHGVAGVTLSAINDPSERGTVENELAAAGFQILEISQTQAAAYCGNCLALSNDEGAPLLIMSERAYNAFTPDQLAVLQQTSMILYTDLSAFETLGGGSARCLLGELF